MLFLLLFPWLAAAEIHPATKLQCQQFQEQLKADPKITTGAITVPVSYKTPNGQKIQIFYWVRKSLRSTKLPPLLLLHGGVGGNSSNLYTWKAVMDAYPGEVVGIDHRGEGCSNYFSYARPYTAFAEVSIENTVLDLESLRQTKFSGKKWRLFGQSRGSAIGHRYLARFPEALESVNLHGLAMQNERDIVDYSVQRSLFNARAGRTFYSKYPAAGKVIDSIREWLKTTPECFKINFEQADLPVERRPEVCGVIAVDAFSGKMSAMAGWEAFAKSLVELQAADGTLNTEGARKLLQANLDSSLYVKFLSYILGTNSQEFHAPDFDSLSRISRIPAIANAPLSEGRFIYEAMYPIFKRLYPGRFKAAHVVYPFEEITRDLLARKQQGKPLPVRLFYGEYDPVAGPEAFTYEKQAFRGVADFIFIPASSHDGWKTHPDVAKVLTKE